MKTQYTQTSNYDKYAIRERLKKDTELAAELEAMGNPHDLSQPFLGYIRKHEKAYAREIGLMKILIREFKGLHDIILSKIIIAYQLTGPKGLGVPKGEGVLVGGSQLHSIIKFIKLKLENHTWLFDPNQFVRQVSYTDFDPIDVSAQNRIIESYKMVYTDSIDMEGKSEFQSAVNDLITDLNRRVVAKGSWEAVICMQDGSIDMDMDISPW